MTDTTAPHGALLPTPVFAAPITNPFGLAGAGNGNSVSPSLVDIDGDGDLDALVGNSDGNTLVFINTAGPSRLLPLPWPTALITWAASSP